MRGEEGVASWLTSHPLPLGAESTTLHILVPGLSGRMEPPRWWKYVSRSGLCSPAASRSHASQTLCARGPVCFVLCVNPSWPETLEKYNTNELLGK